MSIREKLGLGPKNDDQVRTLKDDTAYEVEPTAEQLEADRLEKLLAAEAENDPVAKAALNLQAFELSDGSRSLLDRAMDSISKNTGAGLDDEDARAEARMRAELTSAAGNDLSVVIEALGSSAGETEVAGMVYSYLYSVMKNCVFFANLDYRQAMNLDQYSDDAVVEGWFTRYVSDRYVTEALGRVVQDEQGHDVELSTDAREMHRELPYGFEERRDTQIRLLSEQYSALDIEDAVVRALEDIRVFFQLTAECHGWNPDNPMPFGNTMNPDGSFSPLEDAVTALDAQEVKRQASQAKRRAKRATVTAAATAAARAAVSGALRRR